MRDWFTVDKDGLAKVLGRRGKAFAVLELIQNAWDAPGATQVEVTLKPAARRARRVGSRNIRSRWKFCTLDGVLSQPGLIISDVMIRRQSRPYA